MNTQSSLNLGWTLIATVLLGGCYLDEVGIDETSQRGGGKADDTGACPELVCSWSAAKPTKETLNGVWRAESGPAFAVGAEKGEGTVSTSSTFRARAQIISRLARGAGTV
jgi:hypothetical protein